MRTLTSFDPAQGLISHRSQVVVCDIDECVVNITPKWVRKMLFDDFLSRRCDFSILKETFGKDPKVADEFILNRPIAQLQKWLNANELGRIRFEQLYFDDPDFYSDLKITPLGEELQRSTTPKSLIFVSHTKLDSDKINASKREYMTANFPGARVILAELGTSKAETINKEIGKFDIFIDDSVAVVKDVMENTLCAEKRFIMPGLGYNMSEEFIASIMPVVETKKLDFGYYKNF